MTNRNSKKDKMLEAACEIVAQLGIGAMTLEAVAARAGVSKGGLLYHFPNKDALVLGMIGRMEQQFEADIETEIAREAGQGNAPIAGRWLRAYVRVSLQQVDQSDAMHAALMAPMYENPELLHSMQAAELRWQQRAENDGVSVPVAMVVWLAADGYWLSKIFGFKTALSSEKKLQEIKQTLLDLIESGLLETNPAPNRN